MKRDMDLVRRLLLDIESKEQCIDCLKSDEAEYPGFTGDQVTYHLMLMGEAGLIEGIDTNHTLGMGYIVHRLTWYGHEFLDASRKDSTWEKAKKIIADKAGSVPFSILTSLLVKIAENQIES